ncbi:hypothetical protein SERLADRAFT_448212 [Serpula lacrymans var. lacrymans S7.9]|uniref:Uncharacterized protein n=1 Tax=Serpula lacrymans var. lacrymans (strain S7.9) TaxID=578457 RepID=F8NUJ4_SERL9|nr:uncharacterized protein SERLADRAFT_448212 [Serpula lacrymans var. lacrymans S7.9]EGO25214.1 hypothetical protein SERLADRAFT_448212 [Serpula lacrymans var. lacrymans S7.9]
MIILDEEDQQKLKDDSATGPTLRFPERVAGGRRPFSPLPDYETSQALALNLNRSPSPSPESLRKPPVKKRFDARFWKATLCALTIYITLSIVIGIPLIVTKTRNDNTNTIQSYSLSSLSYPVPWQDKNSNPAYTNNIVGVVQSGYTPVCSNWTSSNAIGYTDIILSTVQYNVSANGDYSFSTNASYNQDFDFISGDLIVDMNPDNTTDSAVLLITMQASSSIINNQTLVCVIAADNYTDLSVYVPGNVTDTDSLMLNFTLLFPQTIGPAYVNSFSTFLPMFLQKFGNLGPNVNFQQVDIEGPLSEVSVGSMQAESILVETSLEPITGQFDVTSGLTLSTIKAPIDANISLYNDPKSEYPTLLALSTGYDNITANVTLLAPNKVTPTRPNFIATMRTFKGALNAAISHDPSSPPTVLRLRAQNDLGPSNVTLDRKYQGTFDVRTKLATATVAEGADPPASSGGASPREYQFDFISGYRVYGWVGWGQRPVYWDYDQQGEAVVESLTRQRDAVDGWCWA